MDAHVHIMAGGLTLQRIDLRAVKSKAAFVAAVQSAAGQFTNYSEHGLHDLTWCTCAASCLPVQQTVLIHTDHQPACFH